MTENLAHLSTLEKAREYHKRVIDAKADIARGFLVLAEALYNIRKQRLYKNLGYSTFELYIHSPAVGFRRSKVFGLINVYEKFVLQYKYPKERIGKIDWSKLFLISAHANLESHEKLLTMAESMPKEKIRKEIRKLKPKSKMPREFGEKINLRVLQHAPMNEMGVVFLFAHLCEKLRFSVDYITTYFPDCVAKQKLPNGKWRQRYIEFEYKSNDFVQHGHNIEDCDLIVCWEHNWKDCPVEVIALKEKVKEFALDREE
jgi:hypothetical protein